MEKGLRECILKGPLAGYPVVGLKATLYDGSYHPVDSSEMAFKMAATIAYKNGMPQALSLIHIFREKERKNENTFIFFNRTGNDRY